MYITIFNRFKFKLDASDVIFIGSMLLFLSFIILSLGPQGLQPNDNITVTTTIQTTTTMSVDTSLSSTLTTTSTSTSTTTSTTSTIKTITFYLTPSKSKVVNKTRLYDSAPGTCNSPSCNPKTTTTTIIPSTSIAVVTTTTNLETTTTIPEINVPEYPWL